MAGNRIAHEARVSERLACLQLAVERCHDPEVRRRNRAFLRGVRVAFWCENLHLSPAQVEAELRAELFGAPLPRADELCQSGTTTEVIENG